MRCSPVRIQQLLHLCRRRKLERNKSFSFRAARRSSRKSERRVQRVRVQRVRGRSLSLVTSASALVCAHQNSPRDRDSENMAEQLGTRNGLYCKLHFFVVAHTEVFAVIACSKANDLFHSSVDIAPLLRPPLARPIHSSIWIFLRHGPQQFFPGPAALYTRQTFNYSKPEFAMRSRLLC